MKMTSKQCFAEAVFHLIRKKGVSQKELARIVGVQEATVSKWVNAKEIPRCTIMDALASALGVPVFLLFLPPYQRLDTEAFISEIEKSFSTKS